VPKKSFFDTTRLVAETRPKEAVHPALKTNFKWESRSKNCRTAYSLELRTIFPARCAGRTVAEALEIARDVASKLIEARRDRDGVLNLPTTANGGTRDRGRGLSGAIARQAVGSHEIWFNPTAEPPGDMPEGTLRAILKQSEIEVDMFLSA